MYFAYREGNIFESSIKLLFTRQLIIFQSLIMKSKNQKNSCSIQAAQDPKQFLWFSILKDQDSCSNFPISLFITEVIY